MYFIYIILISIVLYIYLYYELYMFNTLITEDHKFWVVFLSFLFFIFISLFPLKFHSFLGE